MFQYELWNMFCFGIRGNLYKLTELAKFCRIGNNACQYYFVRCNDLFYYLQVSAFDICIVTQTARPAMILSLLNICSILGMGKE